MSTNTDKIGGNESQTTRIPRPKLSAVPKIQKPTIPSATTDTAKVEKPVVNPLGGMPKKERKTDTVQLKVIKDAKTPTIQLRPPVPTPTTSMRPPMPQATVGTLPRTAETDGTAPLADGTAKIADGTAKVSETAPMTETPSVTKTVKLKGPISKPKAAPVKEAPSATKTVKLKAAPKSTVKSVQEDKTVKMKAMPDMSTGEDMTETSIVPPMPYEDDEEKVGIFTTLMNVASAACVATGLFFCYESLKALEYF